MKSFSNNIKAVLVIAGLSSVASFQAVRQPHQRQHAMQPLNSAAAELSPVDEMCIENVAEFCLHGSCDIEEYEALINQLEEQKSHFITHVANVESLLARLKDSNHPEHDPDDVSKLIGNIKDTLANPPAVKD
mmetsp:Transcript_9378/g.16944  ORF Transcript_9378/g.16944 Transcript_9378/m.16944 type:complete len:132 (+) Transcript_9378:58-453(+)|eukprot:CAMPEP_0201608796 /NCGR_PEP_ID=MMETSP0492-20130828/8924_1 /ASSEMBLY_ACC=CAM_ASM_000837 /TAXON_ID=420259 /ORGANISM="Thalassiosira gravida, Strain GMp14c1" /LENGTH=131 /DNA_ID=CAMNT_0048073775 /DNA_START=68 /DNA_END=463 /DNA_ORIENTATION=+